MPLSFGLPSLALCVACAAGQDIFISTKRMDAASAPAAPAVVIDLDSRSGGYTISVGGQTWYTSAGTPTVCLAGKQTTLKLAGSVSASGFDGFGEWRGTTARYTSDDPAITMDVTLKHYPSAPQLAVGTVAFPAGLDTSNCGDFQSLSTTFPSFNLSAAQAQNLDVVSWWGSVLSTTAASRGLGTLGANGIDVGPVVSTDPTSPTNAALVWSTLDHHKIVPQRTSDGAYSMGMSAAIPKLPAGFNYSVMFAAAPGGVTASMYAWGDLIQAYHRTRRMPSVTLTDIGYYTDDGAYYYVWGGQKEKNDPDLSDWIPPRPWPAEKGLVLVKEALWDQGVPVAYMQLDDWWYQGPRLMGNVKMVVDWNASNSSGLFPNGLPAFSDSLNLPLQLYTPWWSDKFKTNFRTFESTRFHGTKLVVPDDSYAFFADYFDFGKKMTNGRFDTFEIDFLHDNFQGCAACFDDVDAADRWYRGMADAAGERNITIQYCLGSATDMLASLSYPSVVQARASGDYVDAHGNVATLGGPSLLMGATSMAPSKDTLWTASPQPATSSDTKHTGYTTQPHVELDVILATLSLGPVGISDGLNQTDVSLISQAFRSSSDSTLLRPSRPLSTVDAVFANRSSAVSRLLAEWAEPPTSLRFRRLHAPSLANHIDVGKAVVQGSAMDVRSTHATLGDGKGPISHYVLAWMTTMEVTLQKTDLYPPPDASVRLALRKHLVKPAGDEQRFGCEDGKPAVPTCVDVLPAGKMPTLPAVAQGRDISMYGYWSIYEPASNGAYFLGELTKIVHVSPQRFSHVLVGGQGPVGLMIGVKGTRGESVTMVAIDPQGVVHTASVTIGAAGSTEISM